MGPGVRYSTLGSGKKVLPIEEIRCDLEVASGFTFVLRTGQNAGKYAREPSLH